MFGNKNKLHQEFEEQLLAHMDALYNFAYRLTRNREEAGDLVQEASLKSYRYFNRFQKGTNFKAWIMTILRNTFINEYRRKAKEPGKINYDEFESAIALPEIKGYDEEIFGEAVQKCVDALPETLGEIITLFYVEGLSYEEIAKVMDCPIGTVMSRLHIARQMLKKKLITLREKEGKSYGM